MSEREQVMQMVAEMPDYRISDLLAFLHTFEEIPNAETLAAIRETDAMIRTGGGQHFTGPAAEFFALLDEEE